MSRRSRYVPVVCILSQWFTLESARMDAAPPQATHDYSRERAAVSASRTPSAVARRTRFAVRGLLALVAAAGAFLLVLSTFTPVVEIRVLTTSELAGQDTRVSGGELHGIALVLVAAVAVLMLAGALRGARPAMLGLAATGLLALGVVVVLDVPRLDDTGQVALSYENVSAGASTGFYQETLGALLLLLAGGLLFALSTRAGRPRPAGSARAPNAPTS